MDYDADKPRGWRTRKHSHTQATTTAEGQNLASGKNGVTITLVLA